MNSNAASYEAAPGVAPKEMVKIQHLKLNDGNEIPMVGYGAGTAHYKSDASSLLDKSLVATFVMALKAGYHHLDAAEAYGNEAEVGAAIKEAGISRDQLYITTKVSGIQVQDTEESFAVSLRKLGVEYVDQYLIHAPFFADGSEAALQAKWADLEAIQASGRAKTIGVSNFGKRDLETILKTAKVVPAINQIEFHPYLQHGDLLAWHKEKGIATSAYAPLTAVTKASPGPLDDTYAKLARKYGVTPGEIALRWVIDLGVVVLTTSTKEDRLRAYQKVGKFKLTPKECETISEIGKEKNFRGFWNVKFAHDDFS
ncbi:NADP-dependent oxidoreductase domain-containing protein [Calycina marina]|uniref:NADP-dependent oxidoreductase domain-containing protein n=1 Tax=Calycina marina TaxID=1763456 RepID=A0A9P7YWN5_9HELO|nr:NADP-dependent oxidoreductase domain-containing protein [Calycina marina]